jgi:hypothetical protein
MRRSALWFEASGDALDGALWFLRAALVDPRS